jgi:hypothetical protein
MWRIYSNPDPHGVSRKEKEKKKDCSVLKEETLRNHSTAVMMLCEEVFFPQREQWTAVKQVCYIIPYF